MREITAHKINGLNNVLDVHTLDDPGPGGAHHLYEVRSSLDHPQTIRFQNGPVLDAGGVNGITNEALLAIVIDRLQCFQAGEFKCRENAIALTKLEEAMHWLHHRTRDRLARGVEGTLQK